MDNIFNGIATGLLLKEVLHFFKNFRYTLGRITQLKFIKWTKVLGIQKHTKLATKRPFKKQFLNSQVKIFEKCLWRRSFYVRFEYLQLCHFSRVLTTFAKVSNFIKMNFADYFQEVIFTDPILLNFTRALPVFWKFIFIFKNFA